MKDINLVQKIVTWALVLILVLILASVLVKDDKPIQVFTPVPTSGPSPTMTIYPNNGKE